MSDMPNEDELEGAILQTAREMQGYRGDNMLPDRDILIDEVDMDFVQYLITAVNESRLNMAEKQKLRKTLDRWQNALTLTNKIRVTF